jgi:hypothetical protein
MYRLIAAFILLSIPAAHAAAPAVPVPSYWKDAAGSELSLHSIDAKGAFTGTYITHTAGFACANTPFEVHGQAHGSQVRFSVVWKNAAADCKAHTSWYGHVTGKTLATWWVMTSGVQHAAKKTRGTDTFVEQ